MKRVLYSGFFDLFHVGHLRAFEKAKKLGYLIIHVAGDREARSAKGELRPIIPGKERVELIKGLRCVDEVFYSENYLTTEEVIKMTNADILIRNEGSNDKFSIEVVIVPREIPESGLDTTKIIRKIKHGKEEVKIDGINYIIRVGNEILLQRRDNKSEIRCPGMLAIPGGGIELGENPHEAAAREIKEEIGISLSLNDINFLCDLSYPWSETGRFYIVVLDTKPKIYSTEGQMEWHNIMEINNLAGNQNEVLKLLN